ncbi:arf1-directed GTPase-activating related protein [Cyclospora cayetanensis]|uniref:Arf1-directed GTPase-activating related protein n=1 Tax=Cyclospora cayetanensis TaxID=88456 RepID=A0A1D3D7I5_9EIME|nr:arf1-directed GTPase-activating related protein [Cyclospora cayetanensis]
METDFHEDWPDIPHLLYPHGSRSTPDLGYTNWEPTLQKCFDCSSRNPTWISLTHAIYVCLTCSGKHRRLGTHLSFVRSTEMDKIYPEQLFRMELGGNRRAHDFLREHGADLSQPLDYHGKLAAKHRQMLDVRSLMEAVLWALPSLGFAEAIWGSLGSRLTSHKTQTPMCAAFACEGMRSASVCLRVVLPQRLVSSEMQSIGWIPVPSPTPVSMPTATVGAARPGLGDPSWGGFPRPSGAVKGVRSRKLEMDFDFEKEAALLAAKQRAAAQAPARNFGSNGATALGHSASAGGDYGTSGISASGASGSNSNRFSGAKSISSAQYFNDEESAPPVAAVPIDPSRTAIGSDEIFGRSTSNRRGWEDQSAARVEALRMHAQQGWQQLSQAGSDAISKAREWLAGT